MKDLHNSLNGRLPDKGFAPRVELTLYPMEDCGPCLVVKEALTHSDVSTRWRVEIEPLDIGAIRALRRELGRLKLPVLVARRNGKVVASRLGAESPDPTIERQAVLAWLEHIEGSAEINSKMAPT